MTSLGLKIDAWVCGQLGKWGVRTPLFAPAPSGVVVDRNFALCHTCRRVFPHWRGNMTAKEIEKRGFAGCVCGGQRLDIAIIPAWQAAWWLLVRGVLIRRLFLRKRLWDPRVPVRDRDLG